MAVAMAAAPFDDVSGVDVPSPEQIQKELKQLRRKQAIGVGSRSEGSEFPAPNIRYASTSTTGTSYNAGDLLRGK